MIANINYRGPVSTEVTSKMKFPVGKPSQVVDKSGKYTFVFFRSGNCRIMGCKEPLKRKYLPYKVRNIQLQSITIVDNLVKSISLYQLSLKIKCIYEPELFP